MSMTNEYREYLLDLIDAHGFKIIFMNSAFDYDPTTHNTYSDISASEISTGYGYTQNSHTLSSPTISRSDPGNYVDITFTDFSITATGGSIGPASGYCIVDDDTADDKVVGFVTFEGTLIAFDGEDFPINNISIRLAA